MIEKRNRKNSKIIGTKIVIHFCIIIMLLTGIALAEDHDVIIGFNKDISEQKKIVESYNGTVNKNFHIINAVSAKVPVEKIDKMKKDPKIKYVSNISKYKMLDEYSNSSWGIRYIDSHAVHNQNINGTGVNISVLDTGIDYNNPELQDNYKGGYNFISNNADPWDDNCLSVYKTCHGTHVSGIIAANADGMGIIGVAPKSNIFAVKVLDAGGFGDTGTVIAGIQWSIDNGANIISMSLGSYPDPVFPENDIALLDAINTSYNQGILIVAGAGNTGTGDNFVLYPAAFDNVIAVGAIDQNGQKASFSPTNPKIELTAPGVNIYSTVQGGYANLSGTSQATPFVTGVAALIMSSGVRNNTDVRKILDDTATDAGVPGRDDMYGYGIVDASNATLGIPVIDVAVLDIVKVPNCPDINIKKIRNSISCDTKSISLDKGNYSLTIKNINLSGLGVNIYESNTLTSSTKYKLKKSQTLDTNIEINMSRLDFIPYGDKGTTAQVIIRKNI